MTNAKLKDPQKYFIRKTFNEWRCLSQKFVDFLALFSDRSRGIMESFDKRSSCFSSRTSSARASASSLVVAIGLLTVKFRWNSAISGPPVLTVTVVQ